MEDTTKHYVRINEQDHIIKGFSDAFPNEVLETDICINENGQRHFELNGVVNPALVNEQGIALYKYDDGVVERTAEEIAQELAEIELLNSLVPTAEEIAQAERTIETIELLQELEVI
jgi:hypothetical protein